MIDSHAKSADSTVSIDLTVERCDPRYNYNELRIVKIAAFLSLVLTFHGRLGPLAGGFCSCHIYSDDSSPLSPRYTTSYKRSLCGALQKGMDSQEIKANRKNPELLCVQQWRWPYRSRIKKYSKGIFYGPFHVIVHNRTHPDTLVCHFSWRRYILVTLNPHYGPLGLATALTCVNLPDFSCDIKISLLGC